MTHEELLKLVNPDWDEYVDNSKFSNAIRAIVARHFPDGDCSDPGCEPKHLWCNCGYEYPCAVIKDIEREMK